MPAFSRLVRFVAKDGKTYYGDAILPSGVDDISKAKQAHVISGDIFGEHSITGQVAEIQNFLTPLPTSSVHTVRCLGTNYAKHAAEAKMPTPTYPILFFKPPTALTSTAAPIPVPLAAQQYVGIDYECELIIVISRPCRDVSPASALDYVLGYSVGNDVSHREWQIKRGGGQWGFGKGFDGWAPWGPGIVSKEEFARVKGHKTSEGKGLRISTKVNGKQMQEGGTEDMIFDVRETVAFLSQGTTLMPGDLIWTGTPSGVASGRSPPPWLKDGDVVEVGLEGVGTCTNTVKFAKSTSSKL